MKLRCLRREHASRGQALVEFAIILPILALLLVMGLDFGRVFFGWVGVNNAARIAANEAARNPDAWEGSGNAAEQDRYERVVLADLERLNCSQKDVNGDGTIDRDDFLPDFSAGYEVGDEVKVSISCGFDLMTPLAGAVVGDPVEISASTSFLIFGGEINGIPVDPTVVTATCLAGEAEMPNLVGQSVAFARQTWTTAGFPSGSFSPPPAVDDADIVTAQSTSPASSPGDCVSTTSTTVSVVHSPPPTCSSGERNVPSLMGLTVTAARSTWTSAGFSGAFTPASGSDTEVVTGQTVSGGVSAPDCAPTSATVTVTHAPATPPPPASCVAPQLTGELPAAAETLYRNAGFTGAFTTQPNNKPTWTVDSQTLVGGQPYRCTSDIKVVLKNT